MDITEAQKDLIRFHLAGYAAFVVDDALSILSEPQKLILLGVTVAAVGLPPIDPLTLVIVEGVPVATKESILGNLLEAYRKLSPATVDDSLLVESVGKVNLRRDELKARRQLYLHWLGELARFLGFRTDGCVRVGYASR